MQQQLPVSCVPEEEKVACCIHVIAEEPEPLIPIDRYSSYSHLKRITAWMLRFVNNTRSKLRGQPTCALQCLLVHELQAAERYWFLFVQTHHFSKELDDIKSGRKIRRSSSLLQYQTVLSARNESHPERSVTDLVRFIPVNRTRTVIGAFRSIINTCTHSALKTVVASWILIALEEELVKVRL